MYTAYSSHLPQLTLSGLIPLPLLIAAGVFRAGFTKPLSAQPLVCHHLPPPAGAALFPFYSHLDLAGRIPPHACAPRVAVPGDPPSFPLSADLFPEPEVSEEPATDPSLFLGHFLLGFLLAPLL